MNSLERWKAKPISEFSFYILLALTEPLHGYAVMKKVTEISEGTVQIGPGTLYGLFGKLEKEDLIDKVYEDHRRKTYRLSELGRVVLLDMVERLTIMSKNGRAAVERIAAK